MYDNNRPLYPDSQGPRCPSVRSCLQSFVQRKSGLADGSVGYGFQNFAGFRV